MTKAACTALLRLYPHHASVDTCLLWQRLTRGWIQDDALQRPRGRKIKRWPHIADAIAAYEARTQEEG